MLEAAVIVQAVTLLAIIVIQGRNRDNTLRQSDIRHQAQLATLLQSHHAQTMALLATQQAQVDMLLQRIQAPAEAVVQHQMTQELPSPPPVQMDDDHAHLQAMLSRDELAMAAYQAELSPA